MTEPDPHLGVDEYGFYNHSDFDTSIPLDENGHVNKQELWSRNEERIRRETPTVLNESQTMEENKHKLLNILNHLEDESGDYYEFGRWIMNDGGTVWKEGRTSRPDYASLCDNDWRYQKAKATMWRFEYVFHECRSVYMWSGSYE